MDVHWYHAEVSTVKDPSFPLSTHSTTEEKEGRFVTHEVEPGLFALLFVERLDIRNQALHDRRCCPGRVKARPRTTGPHRPDDLSALINQLQVNDNFAPCRNTFCASDRALDDRVGIVAIRGRRHSVASLQCASQPVAQLLRF